VGHDRPDLWSADAAVALVRRGASGAERLLEDRRGDDLGILHIAAFIMEQRTGLDFFWELPDAQEEALEAAADAAWALTWID